MSVITTADERLKSAEGHIREAIKDLSAIVIDQVWGYDGFETGYDKALKLALSHLIEMRDGLWE